MIATMLIMLNLCTSVRMASELNTKRRSFVGQQNDGERRNGKKKSKVGRKLGN